MQTLTCCLLALVVGVATVAAPKTYYVSPQGNDQWSGALASANQAKTDGPFASLTAARDAIRKLKADKGLPPGGVVVLVKGGVYHLTASFALTAEDSGTPAQPIVYRAAPGESVRLTGGQTIPAESLKPLADPAILTRLREEVRPRIVAADLKALGITELGKFPSRYRGAPVAPELFFNDQRMSLARWPNSGWATIEKIVESGLIPGAGENGVRGGIFQYKEDAPSRWPVDKGAWLQGYWCFDWFDETIQVKSTDPVTKQITLAEPATYGVKQGNPSPRRYKALNVLEELDAPGEYYLDRDQDKLYFYPPASLKGARIAVSTLSAPLISLTEASNVTVRGFIIENGLDRGLTINGGSDDRVQACEVCNMRLLGIDVQGGTRHHIEACDVHHTGTGGIAMSGGDRKTLTPCKHEAVNCHVWRYSEHQLTYANAFLVNGVGTRIANCLIHDAPHQAIGVGGNDHIFEYNVLYNICTETDDCGAYYKGRNPSCRGNIVRCNFFHNIGSPMGHGNAAVYFDDGDGGDFVTGNVFFRCGEPGRGSFGTVFSHGGFDLLADNNIFIECKRPLGSAPWPYKRYMDFLNDPMYHKLLVDDVDITSETYTKRYPELVGFLTMPETRQRVSHAVGNVLVMCAAVSSGNWQVPVDQNFITSQDPGFVNAAAGNFALLKDSVVYKKLPGFAPVPFEKMGLYKDELRPILPVQKWTQPAPRPLEALAKTAAATAPMTKGPVPVFEVVRAVTPPSVDGQIAANEWPAQTMTLAQDVGGTPVAPQRQSRAWLSYDAKCLYIAVDNAVSPEAKLNGNQWGTDDAVEVSLQGIGAGKQPPIYVLRGYGNGRIEFGTTPNPNDEPLTMDPGSIAYKVTVPAKGRWVAEVSVPFNQLGLDPATTARVRFNITVRKPLDDLWLMWEGTRGHSYDVAQAGFIEFVK